MYSPGILTAGSKRSPTIGGAPTTGPVHVPPGPGFPIMASNMLVVIEEQTVTGVSCGALPNPE